MKNIGICGSFGFGEKMYNGQTIKTKILTSELIKRYGVNQVDRIDTHNWKKNPTALLIKCLKLIKSNDVLIILPSINGVKVLVPLFAILNIIFKKKLYYFVIGSRLDSYVKRKESFKKYLKQLNKIYVETEILKKNLESQGLKNVEIIPNFKRLKYVKEVEKIPTENYPINLCIFSRVSEEKGVLDAIEVVEQLNEKNKNHFLSLDIYGQIKSDFKERFIEKIKISPEYIKYKGIIEYNQSTAELKKYDALLFPTKMKDEGIPGTIIDAYNAGLPVIASSWNSVEDIVIKNKTGYIFEINNNESFKNILHKIIIAPELLSNLKENCISEAKKYSPDNALRKFYDEIEEIYD